jgi:beta-fructofuranosidase
MRRRSFLALPAISAFARQTRSAKELAADHHRPVYHFLPPANWMNDPNGPIYWKGRYHMFYQYNPNGAYWGTIHWGHAVSYDMVHWRHHGVALAPQPGSCDKNGVFSGCCVVNNGVPTIFYTGTDPEVQCAATSQSDDLRSWRRPAQNPLIAHPPEGLDVTGFRDPCVWEESGAWYMALGSGIRDKGGCVLLYRSPDLLDWTYMQPLAQGKMDVNLKGRGPVTSGEMWECPSFFPLGDKHVLLVSTRGTTPWYVGTYRPGDFTPETEGRVDTGDYYASITQLDSHGRRVVWGWIQEHRSGEAQRMAGWSGVLSLPRVLTLREDRTLGIAPAPQIRSLFGAPQNYVNLFIPEGSETLIPGAEGDAIRIRADIDTDDADECGLLVLCANDLSEHTPVVYNEKFKRLSIGHHPSAEQNGNFELKRGELLRLEIYVDGSVIEAFANGRVCVTGRSYTSRADSIGVGMTARGGTAKIKSMTVIEMKPISPDRMTA